jgi:GNAT superfamily N-acetyltransferase
MDAVLDPTRTAAAWVAVAEGAVVGFGVLEVGGPDYVRHYLGLDTLDLDAPLADRNGLFHMCCVREAWEGRGIGTALHQRRLDALADRGVPRAHGIAWHRPPGHPDSRALFAAHGFTQVASIERYYARAQERAHCPACGGDCSCSASLYTRAVA